MDYQNFRVVPLQNGVLHLILNRPQSLNALNQELLTELDRIIALCKVDKNVTGLIFSGEGKVFCAGADIKELKDISNVEAVKFAKRGQAIFRELELLGKPTIAAIHGTALGGGCELAMACSIRIATSSCTFGQPEIKLGVIPGFGGTQRLTRLIGKSRALELCLTGRKFTASEAYQWGLITEIIEQEENLISRAQDIINSIVSYSPSAISSILYSMHFGFDLSMEAALEIEATYFGLTCNTKNKNEGVNAFLEKRKPNFDLKE